ncbi:MAG: peptidase domain-containing ABC transporter [Cyclobacteriaceae bacterium]|nr:peptidase domain-containing ABC transporter [Cyclobacteriaceae bacterium]UYN87099.1 MAG: peptidase domain-containing ABC transporter [Cyclobacteriaceae bacterium]
MQQRLLQQTFVRQQGQSDCGVACLASVINYHGGETTLEKLRELSGTTQQGTTLLGLYQAARQLGFDAEGLEAESVENLRELQEPAILHVIMDNRLQHYFVYYGFDKHWQIVVGDPTKGIITYKPNELDALWQSKALLKLTPNQNFVKAETQNNQKKQWIIDLVKDDVNVLVAALFLGLIISALGLTTAIFSQKLIDNILPSGDTKKLILSLVLVGILLLARSGLGYLRGFFLVKQGTDFNNRIIQKFYGSLLYLPKSFFDSRKTGELIARMNDTRRIQATISLISGNVLIDLLLIIVAVVFVFAYSSWLGSVMLTCLPVYALLVWLFNNKIIASQKEVMSSYALTEGHYVDTIQGIATVKAANRESFFEKVNKHVYGFFQNKIFELGKLNLRFGLLNEITGVVFMLVVFGLSSWMVLKETLQLGEMVALLSMAGSIIPSLNRLAIANIQFQEARVAFDRLFEFASIKPETQPSESSINLVEIEQLTVNKLSFRFPGRARLLKEISLNVKKGEVIGLLGESGGGKSSFLQIIQKFYKPESGTIEVNGIDLDRISTSTWRNLIGVVPQEVKIFNGNLLYNLTLSDNPDEYQSALEFCKQAGFDKYFESFPQSYLTILGEEGINISGGQKQVVALARALFRQPQLLLLDEATAAMDKNTEAFVLKLLMNLKQNTAVILVTHRIQTARKADRIYILDAGEIVASGTPETLMGSVNFYSESVKELVV